MPYSSSFPLLIPPFRLFALQTDKIRKLFDAFAKRMSVPASSLRFVFDGDRLTGEETAEGLDLEDGDTIDAHTST